jgi:ABC-type transport system involved in Fe-S cluster assembly fused permease/ATPase subunit
MRLSQLTSAGTNAWIAVGIYSALSFANSSACIGWLQFWLWQPIEQYSYDALTSAVHGHVMSLSSEFHESRTASDIHQTINQGRSITNIVDTVCFKVGPTVVDLIFVFAYLLYLFGPYMALDLVVTTSFYLYTTMKLVSLAQKRRRTYHTYWRKEWSSLVSSINNWRVASVS